MQESENITSAHVGGAPRFNSDLLWYVSCFLITAVAVFLRFVSLTLKPLHHDEGVNGWFLTNLFRDGKYAYDPANYHGPTLYYISLAFAEVFGLETFSIRASVAVWGVLLVILTFFLRRRIGKIGSLFAALFLALSPGMVYISRYFIHEMFFVFLSLAIVVAVLFFIEKRRAGILATASAAVILLVCFLPSTLKLAAALGGASDTRIWIFRLSFFIVQALLVGLVIRMLLSWENGRPVYFLLASACASLLFATKETAFITLGTMLIACGCVWMWRKMFKVEDDAANTSVDEDASPEDLQAQELTGIVDDDLTWRNFRAALGSGSDLLLIVISSVVVFIFIAVLFFSSFFTYSGGVEAAIEAYSLWTKTGSKDHTQNGTWAYLKWGMEIEAPIILLSSLGLLIAFVKARHRFAMFAGLWAFGLFAAYSIIPYKTPWLAISFLLPMCIAAGYAINEMVGARNVSVKLTGGLFALIATTVLAYQTYELNFVHYDDEDQAYVYAHTNREFLALMNEVEYYAEKSGRGKEAKIEIVSPDYWPMVWYLRDYKQANFHGHIVDTADAEMIIAKKNDQDADVIKKYSAGYEYVESYALRPGVDLVLLVRKNLAEDGAKELYRMGGE
ncbi:MAG TPA: flippase activity-associated protein Agl23 [Pyrinomonadaceae bacterium]|nr:flippase activity-associated protein Agl23 [Pyrinomonadaceae bacterium]